MEREQLGYHQEDIEFAEVARRSALRVLREARRQEDPVRYYRLSVMYEGILGESIDRDFANKGERILRKIDPQNDDDLPSRV